MQITWLGHSAFAVQAENVNVLIDPWIEKNPASPGLPPGFTPDLIVVTHGHHDHLGDAVPLSRAHDCPVVAVPELAAYLERQGCATKRFNIGGTIEFNGMTLRCEPAVHSSSVGPDRVYAGNPCGVTVEADGIRLYHAGDTALFSDMVLIGNRAPITLALLPIGGTFTMAPEDAVECARLLGARHVAAMHYNTFPAIAQDVDDFARDLARQTDSSFFPLTVGDPAEVA